MRLVQLAGTSTRTVRRSNITPESIPAVCKALGHSQAALADPGFLAAVPSFLNACREHQIPPIIGAWFRLEQNTPVNALGDALIVANDPQGLDTLTQLSTAVLGAPRHASGHLPDILSLKHANNCTVLTTKPRSLEKLTKQGIPHIYGLAVRGRTKPGGPEPGENHLRDKAQKLGIPILGAVPYRATSKKHALAVLDALRESTTFERANADLEKIPFPLPAEELAKVFEDAPEVLENTAKIALTWMADDQRLTEKKLTHQYTENDNQILRERARQGLKARFAFPHEKYQLRLDQELATIEQTGHAGIFLVAADLMDWLRKEGTLTGPGRGSAAGSLVSWCLDITTPDPIQHGLWFERFINPDRISPPDFDLDVEPHFQAAMQEKLKDLWDQGSSRSAGIASWATFRAAAGFRSAAQVKGVARKLQDKALQTLRDSAHPQADIWTRGATPQQEDEDTLASIDLATTFSNLVDDPSVKSCIRDAITLAETNAANALSRHPAAIALLQKPIHELQMLALVTPKKDEPPILQIDHNEAEQAGAVKVDCLGIATLTLLREIRQAIQCERDPWNLPHDDNVFDMLAQGNTLGVFQFEGQGITRALRDIQPHNLRTLTDITALYRPGPMDQLHEYNHRLKGLSFASPPHPKLGNILKDTQGIIVYQEQAMATAVELAGFTPPEADSLRRAIGKKKHHEMLSLKERFFAGCKETTPDLSPEKTLQIWNMLESQAGYAFNLAHATCYAIIGYATAWYRHHHIGPFLAALASTALVRAESAERVKAIKLESARFGIRIEPPDLLRSLKRFLFEGETNSILSPPQSLHGVGRAILPLMEIPPEERPRSLKGWMPLFRENNIDSRQIHALAQAGAFRSLRGGKSWETSDTLFNEDLPTIEPQESEWTESDTELLPRRARQGAYQTAANKRTLTPAPMDDYISTLAEDRPTNFESLGLILNIDQRNFNDDTGANVPRIRLLLGDAFSTAEIPLARKLVKDMLEGPKRKKELLQGLVSPGKAVLVTVNEREIISVRPPDHETDFPLHPPMIMIFFPPDIEIKSLREDLLAITEPYKPGSAVFQMIFPGTALEQVITLPDRIIPDVNLAHAIEARFPGTEVLFVDNRTWDTHRPSRLPPRAEGNDHQNGSQPPV